jgi:hypothetical protein
MQSIVAYALAEEIILRYKFLILVTRNLDTLYLLERGCEDPWLFFEVKRGPRAKFGKHFKGLQFFIVLCTS